MEVIFEVENFLQSFTKISQEKSVPFSSKVVYKIPCSCDLISVGEKGVLSRLDSMYKHCLKFPDILLLLLPPYQFLCILFFFAIYFIYYNFHL